MTTNDATSTLHEDAPGVDLATTPDDAEPAAAEAAGDQPAAVDATALSVEGDADLPVEGGTDGVVDGDEPTAVDLTPASPYDLPGSWYVVHSYSGYENKVKANLTTRVKSMHLEDKVFDVVIPLEEVVEFKGGKKVNVLRKKFPGYILVRLFMDDDTWYAVRNTPGVTGFVGSGSKPTPLSRREVERILGVRKDEEEKKEPRFKPAWEVGETVRVVEGPFADFNGVIEDINVDQSKVTVLVDIFGRETPVELNFDQILKF
jgi:transcription termination/antitermination protein NusG